MKDESKNHNATLYASEVKASQFRQIKQTGKMPFIKYVIFTQFEFVLCNSHESPNTLKIKYWTFDKDMKLNKYESIFLS